MSDESPNIPRDLVEKLTKLDPSNPQDLDQLFALSSELCDAAGVERHEFGIPSPPEPDEDPTPAYLAAADPTVSLEDFISIVGNDHQQLVNNQSLLFPSCLAASLTKSTWLLVQGLDPNHADTNGYTPLIYACLPGHRADLSLIQLLLERGSDVNARSSYNESPLRLLTREGNFEGVRLLLDHGADDSAFPPIHQAAANGDLEALVSLLGPDTIELRNDWERTPWLTALQADQIPAAELLQAQGADTSAVGHMGDTALHLAAENNATIAVQLLLSAGHDLNVPATYGQTPLHSAVENDALDTARLLLAAGADIHALTRSADAPISFADSVPMLELLHEHGANLNQMSGDGRWPLMNFAECNDLDGLRWLSEHGAKIDLTSTGATALHAAIRFDNLEAAKFLLESGANPNARDVDGDTPIHSARSLPAAKLLLEYGADPSIPDMCGTLPVNSEFLPKEVRTFLQSLQNN